MVGFCDAQWPKTTWGFSREDARLRLRDQDSTDYHGAEGAYYSDSGDALDDKNPERELARSISVPSCAGCSELQERAEMGAGLLDDRGAALASDSGLGALEKRWRQWALMAVLIGPSAPAGVYSYQSDHPVVFRIHGLVTSASLREGNRRGNQRQRLPRRILYIHGNLLQKHEKFCSDVGHGVWPAEEEYPGRRRPQPPTGLSHGISSNPLAPRLEVMRETPTDK
ncbi:hypothetical protein GGX14DRAFT_395639 [Mycena pura]|uniref:Uncharacterized protein n=1 Tax=Mycena pura TaxID=153505 RepID=A0AAD6YGD3_9AGAR|nr:hypothetical protein GGX14DRAFT_395639 [Mycena pura]